VCSGVWFSVVEIGYFGTVGAVVWDCDGNFVVVILIGGMINKCWGWIGDLLLIGVGNYADNVFCVVLVIGSGEYFIRTVLAYEICLLVRYWGMFLDEVIW
jgi:Asparaginase